MLKKLKSLVGESFGMTKPKWWCVCVIAPLVVYYTISALDLDGAVPTAALVALVIWHFKINDNH